MHCTSDTSRLLDLVHHSKQAYDFKFCSLKEFNLPLVCLIHKSTTYIYLLHQGFLTLSGASIKKKKHFSPQLLKSSSENCDICGIMFGFDPVIRIRTIIRFHLFLVCFTTALRLGSKLNITQHKTW